MEDFTFDMIDQMVGWVPYWTRSREPREVEAPAPAASDSVPAVSSWTLAREPRHSEYSICQGPSTLKNEHNG